MSYCYAIQESPTGLKDTPIRPKPINGIDDHGLCWGPDIVAELMFCLTDFKGQGTNKRLTWLICNILIITLFIIYSLANGTSSVIGPVSVPVRPVHECNYKWADTGHVV